MAAENEQLANVLVVNESLESLFRRDVRGVVFRIPDTGPPWNKSEYETPVVCSDGYKKNLNGLYLPE